MPRLFPTYKHHRALCGRWGILGDRGVFGGSGGEAHDCKTRGLLSKNKGLLCTISLDVRIDSRSRDVAVWPNGQRDDLGLHFRRNRPNGRLTDEPKENNILGTLRALKGARTGVMRSYKKYGGESLFCRKEWKMRVLMKVRASLVTACLLLILSVGPAQAAPLNLVPLPARPIHR